MSRLTSTFQSQLFHHRRASDGSYGSRMRFPPVRVTGLLTSIVLTLVVRAISTTRFVAHTEGSHVGEKSFFVKAVFAVDRAAAAVLSRESGRLMSRLNGAERRNGLYAPSN
jgi:hypothetical protein